MNETACVDTIVGLPIPAPCAHLRRPSEQDNSEKGYPKNFNCMWNPIWRLSLKLDVILALVARLIS